MKHETFPLANVFDNYVV